MFTAADFKLIQRMCPMDLMRLLNLLDIESDKMNFKIGDEFENYENLDAEIDKKICAKLKSSSLIEGYAKLLDCGMIEFQLNETMNELLKKILDNKEKILSITAVGNNDSSDASVQSPVPLIIGGICFAVGIGHAIFAEMVNPLVVGAGVIAGIVVAASGKKDRSKVPQIQNKLTRAQVENILPILERVNKIFDTIESD